MGCSRRDLVDCGFWCSGGARFAMRQVLWRQYLWGDFVLSTTNGALGKCGSIDGFGFETGRVLWGGVRLIGIETNILGCTAEILRNAAGAVRRRDCEEVWNLRDDVQIRNSATSYAKAVRPHFIPVMGLLW